MVCIVCRENGREIESMGGGRRFHCEDCGGYYRMSSSLDAMLGDRKFDVERTRSVLQRRRADLLEHPRGEGRDQDFEPALISSDEHLLVAS